MRDLATPATAGCSAATDAAAATREELMVCAGYLMGMSWRDNVTGIDRKMLEIASAYMMRSLGINTGEATEAERRPAG